MKIIKKLLINFFRIFNLEIKKKSKEPWLNDINFLTIRNIIKNKTLVSDDRLFILYQLIKQVCSLDGGVVECGVYKGGTAKLLGDMFNKFAPSKKLYFLDTFSGMPETDKLRDFHKKGDFGDVEYLEVKEFLKNNINIFIYKGFFSDNFSSIIENKFCFIHIDCDIYNSVKECCEFFYSKMVVGGIMIFDDYGFKSCPGAKLAVDEFFIDKKEMVILLPTKQAVVIKI
jgi:O-methyltransferase